MVYKTKIPDFVIKTTTEKDVPLLIEFINGLAEYEKLTHEVVVTEKNLTESLFDKKVAEAVIGYYKNEPVGFALFFHNFSTFLGLPGIYLEDLFVKPEQRGKGYGKMILTFLANLAKERNCGRFEWSVLDWNEPAINFYKSLGAESKNEWIINRLTGQALDDLAGKF